MSCVLASYASISSLKLLILDLIVLVVQRTYLVVLEQCVAACLLGGVHMILGSFLKQVHIVMLLGWLLLLNVHVPDPTWLLHYGATANYFSRLWSGHASMNQDSKPYIC
jgi:hypothetical protein